MRFTVEKQKNGTKLFKLDLKAKTISVGSVCDSAHGSSFPAVTVSVSEGAAPIYRALGRACQKFSVLPEVSLEERAGQTPRVSITFTFKKLTAADLRDIQKALPRSISVPVSEEVGPQDELRMRLVAPLAVPAMRGLQGRVIAMGILYLVFHKEEKNRVFQLFSMWCKRVSYVAQGSPNGGRKAA